mmetsp:Transcript_20400/g.30256  ORF Transcript_20400/g.30256 Transcript_20400/m.30256 type:complete len:640 (-) Transcript_20400:108-2027(-)
MVYCPRSIMESISSPNHPNAAAAADEHHHQVVVPFPSLNPNPPTDSEEGTVEEEATAAAASSTDDGHGDDEGGSAGESSSSIDDQREEEEDSLNTNEKKRSMSSSSSSCSSSSTTCEEHGGACCCPPIPNLVGASDPSSIMKTYLNELVAYLKVQKEQHLTNNNNEGGENWNTRNNNSGDKKKKRRKLEQQQLLRDGEKMPPASSSSTATSNSSKQSSTMSYQEEKSSKEPIDTIMHWMDSFQDDETIQLMCLQSLPTVLEDPILRRTAQSDGLASIVLYDMAAFPSNSLLILTAFHTLVVLLRPLGTNEGMVHKASSVAMTQRSTMSCTSSKGIRSISKMSAAGVAAAAASAAAGGGASSSTTEATAAINSVNFKGTQHSNKRRSNSTSSSSSVISNTQLYDPSMKNQLTNWEENGVRVMLDSLRRFSNDRYLQAMGCWAMVNAALYPSLKSGLTRLGGVYAVTNAMMLHPNAEAVQFRGLFALINLVIPERDSNNERSGSSIHSHVYQIARLTILAMKNFHTNKSILNRGCLVLRNLSLTPSFVKILGRTPGCVDMLLHCRQICPRDALVQRSARTIMVMIQRATEKEQLMTMKNNAHDRHSFTLTQPFPVPSREEAVDRSTSTTPTLSLGESQQKR